MEGLSGQGFENVSLEVRPGEIVGIAGIVGNGQAAFLRALAGRDNHSAGTVSVGGRVLARAPPQRCRLHARRSLDRRPHDGAECARERVADRTRPATDRSFVSHRREVEAVERELSELAVKAPSLEAPVSALSGGNQQKVVMTRAMLSEPALFVADEPTQGVDVGARAEIYRILREIAARDVPVVVGSSDTKELEGLCDRVIVMSRGHAVATLEGDQVTEENIVQAEISATTHASQRMTDRIRRRARTCTSSRATTRR